MGLEGRKRRLNTFDRRADQFKSALMKGGHPSSKKLVRDGKEITIGTGQHKGLILKNNPRHVMLADRLSKRLLTHFGNNAITPKTFVLVFPQHYNRKVQEYFHKPSLEALVSYLSPGQNKASLRSKQPDEYRLCKQFINQRQNKPVTAMQLVSALNEFSKHLNHIGSSYGKLLSLNLIVLGRTKEGKLRLALVDV